MQARGKKRPSTRALLIMFVKLIYRTSLNCMMLAMDIEREKNCTLLLESPDSTPLGTCYRTSEPSKILTRLCVPSRADSNRIFYILSPFVINSRKSMNTETSRFQRISRQTTIKAAGNGNNCIPSSYILLFSAHCAATLLSTNDNKMIKSNNLAVFIMLL